MGKDEDGEGEEGKKVKPSHRLLIKSAILMPTAKDEVTMVQVESEGYNKAKVTVPICAMQGGADLQKYLDLLIPAPPATLKIINGEGPIHLIGSHCVDYYGFKDDDETEDEDEDAEEEREMLRKRLLLRRIRLLLRRKVLRRKLLPRKVPRRKLLQRKALPKRKLRLKLNVRRCNLYPVKYNFLLC